MAGTEDSSQASSILQGQSSNPGLTQADGGGNADANTEAVKDQVDGAVRTSEKLADESSGGRVIVAETGDLNELAARRRSASAASKS